MEQRIGFGMRLGAYLIDLVIVCVLSFVGGTFVAGMLGIAGSTALSDAALNTSADSLAVGMAAVGGMLGAVIGFVAAIALIGVVYFLIEGFTGYTLGKLILGIRVANADGTKAGIGTLLGRFALKRIDLIFMLAAVVTTTWSLLRVGQLAGLIMFIGCFFVLGVKKQAFHDMIMKTAVYPKAAIKA
jgi:uncharacterized RDD family membrane protein YckC